MRRTKTTHKKKINAKTAVTKTTETNTVGKSYLTLYLMVGTILLLSILGGLIIYISSGTFEEFNAGARTLNVLPQTGR